MPGDVMLAVKLQNIGAHKQKLYTKYNNPIHCSFEKENHVNIRHYCLTADISHF